VLSGCQTYQPQPLDSQIIDTIAAEQAETRISAVGETLSLTTAAQWMSTSNPDLAALRQEYKRLESMAAVRTPLPNPELDLGLARAFRISGATASRTQPFAALGFSIPLGPRREANDNLKGVEAERARTAVVARHRKLYLELRAAYVRHTVATQRLTEQEALIADAIRLKEAGVQLAGIGNVSALDVGMLDLDVGRLKLERSELRMQVAERRSELAALIGVSRRQLEHLRTPQISAPQLPDTAALVKKLAANNTDLAVLRADHAVAEAALRLEVANQYPDLHIGTSGEQEPGEETRFLELSAGIDLPLFDRNQEAITAASETRTVVRTAYRTKAAKLLTALEASQATAVLIDERRGILREELQPHADKNLEQARKLLEAGQIDVLRYLELKRGVRELRMAELAILADAIEAVLDIEGLVGAPLIDLGAASDLPTFQDTTEADKE
jgi:outer membrane protein TolC